jgi:hypothetical protein
LAVFIIIEISEDITPSSNQIKMKLFFFSILYVHEAPIKAEIVIPAKCEHQIIIE